MHYGSMRLHTLVVIDFYSVYGRSELEVRGMGLFGWADGWRVVELGWGVYSHHTMGSD